MNDETPTLAPGFPCPVAISDIEALRLPPIAEVGGT